MAMHNFESMRNNIKMSKVYTNASRLTVIPIVLLLVVSVVHSVELACTEFYNIKCERRKCG